MKKFSFFLSFLILSNLTFSQDKKTGSVLYIASLDVSILGNYATKAPKKYIQQISETLNNTKDVNYLLVFNNINSHFSKENKLENESKNKRNLTETKAGKGVYFTDRDKNEKLHQKNSFGEQFLISLPKVKWNITNEKKMIGKYLCYKATTFKTIESRRGQSKIKVEAWYAPEIQYNYGPKNYNGLPGLIINLKEGDLMFSAKNIKITSNKKLKLIKPQKGKKIKLEEFNKMVKKMFKNNRRN